jgi:spore coat polysaccharide biosynthesis predicted glycosyltransferase SpsG
MSQQLHKYFSLNPFLLELMIIFRVNASAELGLGHLRRMQAIYEYLHKPENVLFAVNQDITNTALPESYNVIFKGNEVSEESFLLQIKTEYDPAAFVFDIKYPYSKALFKNLKGNSCKIVVLDALFEGLQFADHIIYPAAHLDWNILADLLSAAEQEKKVKTGFDYIILRKEIRQLSQYSEQRSNGHPTIGITTGGSDPAGVLPTILNWLKDFSCSLDLQVHAFYGDIFMWQDDLNRAMEQLPSNINVSPFSLNDLNKMDIVICTFGVSVYEWMYLGKKVICIGHNEENAVGAEILCNRVPEVQTLGYFRDISKEQFYRRLKTIIKAWVPKQNRKQRLIDGNGAERIARIVEASNVNLG